jgi:predicted fused transcriptional regulator/phosphomethylpyrimidine kinase
LTKHRWIARVLTTLVLAISLTGLTGSVSNADGGVEQRIADFWKRVDALQPTDYLSAADLGQWALNVIERNPRARTTIADFRTSTGEMQAGMDRAGLAPLSATPVAPVAGVEQRIADYWRRVDALQPSDFLLAADLGQWALNVIDRNPRARTNVADFRFSTGLMQAGMDRAGLAPAAVTPPASGGVPGGIPNATGPVPPAFTRYGGTVVDAATGLPIPGVCVYSGPPAGCPLQGTPRTDATGWFAIDYPAGVTFLWTFEHPSYLGLLSQPIVGGTSPTFRLTHR